MVEVETVSRIRGEVWLHIHACINGLVFVWKLRAYTVFLSTLFVSVCPQRTSPSSPTRATWRCRGGSRGEPRATHSILTNPCTRTHSVCMYPYSPNSRVLEVLREYRGSMCPSVLAYQCLGYVLTWRSTCILCSLSSTHSIAHVQFTDRQTISWS